jgi:hypothetical protein
MSVKWKAKKSLIKKEYFCVIVVGCIILILWLLNLFWLINKPEKGSFGDMFGAVNALFSGFAFAGVIYAIILQKKELSLQRKELELTRNELHRSAEAQIESQKALKLQANSFEQTTKINTIHALLQVFEKDKKEREKLKHKTANNQERQQLYKNATEIHQIIRKQKQLEKKLKDYYDEIIK